MNVEINLNQLKGGIELLFDKQPSDKEMKYLKSLGFKSEFWHPDRYRFEDYKWYAKDHPAYRRYAEDLKEALAQGESLLCVKIYPSYSACESNIDHKKFSYVNITFWRGEELKRAGRVVFEDFKRPALDIATRYAKKHYGQALAEVQVFPRTQQGKARVLLEEGLIIT